MGGRSDSDVWVGSIVWLTIATSSSIKVSRSTCWRRRVANASMVLAVFVAAPVEAPVHALLDAAAGRLEQAAAKVARATAPLEAQCRSRQIAAPC
jgi:hypothetical protein